MTARRLLRGLTQLGRYREMLQARSITRDWLTLTLAYVTGSRRGFPFSIELTTGPFEFQEPSDVPTFWQIFFAGLYSVEPTDRLIIDAGANIGAFTLFALLRSQAQVIAVEPAPDTCERLCRLVTAHGFHSRCTILQAALSAEAGTTTIETGPFSQFRVAGKGGAQVAAITLDELVAGRDVDLLKLDAEGAEYLALPSASAYTMARIRRIEMEYHPSGDPAALFALLAECGFSVVKSQGNHEQSGYGMATLVQQRPR